MTTYRRTLNFCLEAYPEIFQTESKVLEHLFFVIGNGYEWSKGELVDRSCSTMRKEIKQVRNERIAELGHCDVKKILKQQEEREQKWNEHLARLNPSIVKEGKTIYPLCEYSKITHIPTDVKPDWLEAAGKALLLSQTLIRTAGDNGWLEKASVRINELMLSRKLAVPSF